MSDPKSTAPLFLVTTFGQVLSVGGQTFIRRMERGADGKEVWTEEVRGEGPYKGPRQMFRESAGATSSIGWGGPSTPYPFWKKP